MNTREMTSTAAGRLDRAPAAKGIVLIYAGIVTGLAAAITLISLLLDLQIGKTGGLGNLGTRSILSSVQAMLPILQTMFLMCLTMGYRAAMLRVARGQYTSPQTLRLGFDRFWVLLRCTLIRGLMFLGIGIGCMYLATLIYAFTPLSRPLVEMLAPMLGDLTVLDPAFAADEAFIAQVMPAMMPMLGIFLILFALASIPVLLRYRMTDYVIIDRPGFGALASLRESRLMMRGNYWNLIKLDLRLWWYFAASIAAGILCYGDQLLPLLGVNLHMSADAAYYVFYFLYLAVQFAIYCFLMNRVETAYALAYETIRPQEKQPEGVVLGNIFQM